MFQGMKLFSSTSGLLPNEGKTEVYCSGMNEVEVNKLLAVSGYRRSHLPFRYLGIPICMRKISSTECKDVIEKMIKRIRTWSSRHLSYMARLQLVNSVLLAIHSYWSQILILPKKVLKEVTQVCREFI